MFDITYVTWLVHTSYDSFLVQLLTRESGNIFTHNLTHSCRVWLMWNDICICDMSYSSCSYWRAKTEIYFHMTWRVHMWCDSCDVFIRDRSYWLCSYWRAKTEMYFHMTWHIHMWYDSCKVFIRDRSYSLCIHCAFIVQLLTRENGNAFTCDIPHLYATWLCWHDSFTCDTTDSLRSYWSAKTEMHSRVIHMRRRFFWHGSFTFDMVHSRVKRLMDCAAIEARKRGFWKS